MSSKQKDWKQLYVGSVRVIFFKVRSKATNTKGSVLTILKSGILSLTRIGRQIGLTFAPRVLVKIFQTVAWRRVR